MWLLVFCAVLYPFTSAYVTLISSPHNISGRLCPGTAVFTCNAMTMSNLIQLFINDTQVADYILTSGDTYPHDVQSSLPEASVMLTSVTVKANNIITYENFTLSINIQDLNQYIGNNISCGTLLQRSSAIKIESYSIIELPDILPANINVRYSATYSNSDGILNEVNLNWTNVKYLLKCSIEVYYIIKWMFTSSNTSGDVTQYELNCTTEVCTFTLNTQDASPSHEEDSLEVSVTVKETTLNYSATISTSASEVVGGYSEMECGIYIECTSATMDGCTLQIGQNQDYNYFTESIIISVNSSYNWNFSDSSQGIYFFQLSSEYSGARSDLRFNISSENTSNSEVISLIVTGYIVFALAIIILTLGLVYCVFIVVALCRQEKKAILNADYILPAMLLVVQFIILLPTVVVWILVHTDFQESKCGRRTYKLYLALSATVLSLCDLLIFAVITGLVIIATKCPCYKGYYCPPMQEITYEANEMITLERILKFGKKFVPHVDNEDCLSCNKLMAYYGRTPCQSCNQDMCSECKDKYKVYVPRNRQVGAVCEKCNAEYWNENVCITDIGVKELARLQVKLDPDVAQCCVCKKNEKEKSLKACPSCS